MRHLILLLIFTSAAYSSVYLDLSVQSFTGILDRNRAEFPINNSGTQGLPLGIGINAAIGYLKTPFHISIGGGFSNLTIKELGLLNRFPNPEIGYDYQEPSLNSDLFLGYQFFSFGKFLFWIDGTLKNKYVLYHRFSRSVDGYNFVNDSASYTLLAGALLRIEYKLAKQWHVFTSIFGYNRLWASEISADGFSGNPPRKIKFEGNIIKQQLGLPLDISWYFL